MARPTRLPVGFPCASMSWVRWRGYSLCTTRFRGFYSYRSGPCRGQNVARARRDTTSSPDLSLLLLMMTNNHAASLPGRSQTQILGFSSYYTRVMRNARLHMPRMLLLSDASFSGRLARPRAFLHSSPSAVPCQSLVSRTVLFFTVPHHLLYLVPGRPQRSRCYFKF